MREEQPLCHGAFKSYELQYKFYLTSEISNAWQYKKRHNFCPSTIKVIGIQSYTRHHWSIFINCSGVFSDPDLHSDTQMRITVTTFIPDHNENIVSRLNARVTAYGMFYIVTIMQQVSLVPWRVKLLWNFCLMTTHSALPRVLTYLLHTFFLFSLASKVRT